ncbi:MAG: SdrD B-like domain-containing protein, partial [Eubacteriales bacterium]|nr:SdrD B-like domain-containing protein [Eubacteriales bacterium]
EGWSAGDSCVGGTEDATALSDALTLVSGQTAEAGVAAIPVGSFSGKVWNDQNNNGVMDADEAGVANVVLKLTGTKTGADYQITTDDTGEYRFSLLRNDTYNFTAELPEGYLFARYTKTGGDSRSVFTTDGTSSTRQFVVSGAEDVTNKNVGVIQKAALSGIAFLDTNYNGVYNEGEPPYAGVTLEVIKNSNSKSMGKVVTGEDGTYTFASLRGGDYRLRAILPNDGSIFTFVPESGTGLVNQFVAREGRRENSIQSVAVVNGSTTETCVGVALGGTVTGTVFYDKKYDGVMDSGDSAASGIKVQLVDSLGGVAATATTNGKGGYTLEGIMPGDYIVRFQRKDGYAFTRYRPDEENGNDVALLAKDGYGETATITVAMGQTIEQLNAGMLPSSTLTGVFFDDLNDDGLRDEGENGYTDGSVRLLSDDGEIDLTESVAEDGTYFFDGVMPGEYTVTYLLPENATLANVAEGGNTLEAQGRQNVLAGFTVESGKAYEAPLVGAVTLGSFAGYAYHDQNGNNVRDDGEETLAGVAVTCTPKNGTPAQAVTGADGAFSLTGLRPGEYTLSIALPDGYIISGNLTQSGLTLDAASSDSLSCPWSALINRAQNAVGAVQPATVVASVWLDENRDGTHAENERLLSGLAYELYDEQLGRTVKTARSDDDGYVTFENVRPSTYTVRFTLPEQAQPADAEGDFTRKGNVMAHTGVVVTEGETVKGITGGLVSYTSIGGTVSLEENGARTVQPGVAVSLYQGDDTKPLATTVTDETGTYRFDGLWPDTYRLTVAEPDGTIFVRPDDPNYDAGASIVTGSTDGVGESDAIELQMAQHQLSMNVILIKPARVGDQVWLDSNQNGLMDVDEPSLNGVTVQLTQNGEAVYTTVSNEWGYYEFANVYPGTYTLVAQAYPELAITQSIPALRIISSCLTSGDGTSAQSDPFSVESGTKNFDFDLGYILPDGAKLPAEIVAGSVQYWPATQESEE